MANRASTGRFALALAAGALLAGCREQGPARDAAGTITKAGETRLLKLRTGDCVSNLRDRLDHPDGMNNGVPKVEAVGCSRSHDGELVKIARLDNGDWPGFNIVDGEAARGRLQLAVRLARVKAVGGRIQVVSFRPTRERWEFENQHAIYYFILYEQPQRTAAPK